jgi:hypothetical protein
MQTVRLERSGEYGQTMIDMRTWLDRHGIQPIGFRTFSAPRGSFAVELSFSRADQADRFAKAFAVASPRLEPIGTLDESV